MTRQEALQCIVELEELGAKMLRDYAELRDERDEFGRRMSKYAGQVEQLCVSRDEACAGLAEALGWKPNGRCPCCLVLVGGGRRHLTGCRVDAIEGVARGEYSEAPPNWRKMELRLRERIRTMARRVKRYTEGVRVRRVLEGWPALVPLTEQLERDCEAAEADHG
jgi:hypothetical protein